MPRVPSAPALTRRAVDTGENDVARGAGSDVVLERWRRLRAAPAGAVDAAMRRLADTAATAFVDTDRLHFDRPGHARLTAALRAALARTAPLG